MYQVTIFTSGGRTDGFARFFLSLSAVTVDETSGVTDEVRCACPVRDGGTDVAFDG
jgi:hypothetical protein